MKTADGVARRSPLPTIVRWGLRLSVFLSLALPGAVAANARTKPLYYVTVAQAKATPGKDATTPFRAEVRLAIARGELVKALEADPDITSNAKDAKRFRLRPWSLDVGITRFEQHYRHDQIELEAEIKVSVADERGRIISVMSKTVTLPVRRCDYHPMLMKQFVRDLVMGATGAIADELPAHLQQQVARR